MKIDKLYTLSQFVDYLDSVNLKEFCKLTGYPITITDMEWTSACFYLTKKYKEFLKQPLTKQMFVNEIEKPSEESYIDYNHDNKFFDHEEYEIDLKAWEKAEKKVIFEEIPYNYKAMISECLFQECSLGDVAKYSNGQLKLKNVEI